MMSSSSSRCSWSAVVTSLRLIEESGPMRPAEALDLVSQAAMGLADAHRAGLLHRDVKPANILVRETEGDVFAYLCDFGIARDGAGFHTRTSGLMGTAGYMAPERHEGADASVATDIYSLGCVLWAALTGQPPYGRTSDVQVALAHMQAPVPVFEGETVARDQLNEILQRSMAKDPTHRYRFGARRCAGLSSTHTSRPRACAPTPPTTLKCVSNVRLPAARWAQPCGRNRQSHPPVEVEAPRRSGRWRGLVLVAAATIAVAAMGAGGHTPAHQVGAEQNDPAKTAVRAAQGHTHSTKPSVTAKPKKARPKVKASQCRLRARRPRPPSPTPASSPRPHQQRPHPPSRHPPRRCWDGKKVYDATDCSTPVGRVGMHAVFPSHGRQVPVR